MKKLFSLQKFVWDVKMNTWGMNTWRIFELILFGCIVKWIESNLHFSTKKSMQTKLMYLSVLDYWIYLLFYFTSSFWVTSKTVNSSIFWRTEFWSTEFKHFCVIVCDWWRNFVQHRVVSSRMIIFMRSFRMIMCLRRHWSISNRLSVP